MTSNPADDRKALLKNALLALDEMQAKLNAMEHARREPIAIIGLSCRFPGAENPEAYWRLLHNGVDAIREIPAERWNMPDHAGVDMKWYGGFLDNIDRFDPQFFGISPREAQTLDPQQRLVLEVAWEALERAGQPPDGLANSLTGVFIGITTNDYAGLVKESAGLDMDVYSATGTALNAAAGRLAYTLGLQGPCLSVDTACSSSLVAIHLACQSLRSRESHLAIAGGVNVTLAPENFICFNGWGMMAPDGRCKTFDSRADGFVRGEGCGIIVLKRLSDALTDNDSILAVIRGSAVNQDGHSSGLTVPNGLAQQAVIRTALTNAAVSPAEISYVEAHGTGTSLGDPIEVEAIGAVLGEGRGDEPLLVGSVKTNIGHLESASGVAGLIKVVLAMGKCELPPHLHLRERNPRIPWPSFPVIVPTTPTPWPAGEKPRRAGVSSFGFSGTNAHIILEEPPAHPLVEAATNGRPLHVLALSARSESALRALAGQYVEYLADANATPLSDIAYTANTGRAHFVHRAAVVADSPQNARAALEALAAGQTQPRLTTGSAPAGRHKIAFLFTGQGSQYAGMGRALYDSQPVFRKALDECDRLLQPYLDQSLLSVIQSDAPESPLDYTTYTQPALFALEYALAQMWLSWGIEPAAVMGHSVGEYVAACIAGVFSLEDGLKLIAARARLMGDLPVGGQMVTVFADEKRVATALKPYTDLVSIGAVNGSANIVISGDSESVQTILAQLHAEGVKSRPLVVSHAFHSPLMEPMLDAFELAANAVHFDRPRIKLISNVTGAYADSEVMSAGYWRKHVREPVRFADSIQTLTESGFTTFVEIGPGTTLLSMGQHCIEDTNPSLWLPSLRKGQDEWATALTSLSTLYTRGSLVDWQSFDQGYERHKVVLPTYAFQRERFWVAPPTAQGSPIRRDARAHPLLGTRLSIARAGAAVWENDVSLKRHPYLADHRVEGAVVVPATAYVEMAAAAAAELIDGNPLRISGVKNRKPLFLRPDSVFVVQTALTPSPSGGFDFEIASRPNAPDAAWTLHVTGHLESLPETVNPTVLSGFDPDAIMARCTEMYTGESFYQQLSLKGNQWGPFFQGVERLWRGNGEALSLVRVPVGLENQISGYRFHPAVSDSCGHVMTATISMEKSNETRGGAFVGGGIDESRLYEPPSGLALWCYARLRPHEGDENMLIGDVAVYDETGRLVAETVGARLWYLDHSRPALENNTDNWYYEIVWEAISPPDGTASVEGNWLILADSGGVGEALATRLEAGGGSCTLVFPGPFYTELDGRRWRVRPDSREDFSRLIGAAPYRGIIHLWSLDTPDADDLMLPDLETAQRLCLTSTLRLTQALFEVNQRPRAHLWLVTRGAQPVDGDSPGLAQSPLWGIGRSLAIEGAEFWGGLVDLDPVLSPQDSGALVRQVLASKSIEDQVAFRAGQAYVPRLVHKPVKLGTVASPVACRPDGSYLITGGFGGLGLEVARWLVERGACRLILMGHSPLPPRSQWGDLSSESREGRRAAAVRELEAMGASVHLAFVDVADEAAVREYLDLYKAEGWPAVRGVIHAAGTMQYQPLVEQTPDEIARVLNPKVVGAWLLHHLLSDAPLDWFVLFSSTSSLLSSPLMSSYSAANVFLDNLAHYRRARGLPTLSVNWGTWGETGMATTFDSSGRSVAMMQTISNQQGLEVLERLMQQPAPQVGVMPLDWEHWRQMYPVFSRAPMLSRLFEFAAGESTPQEEHYSVRPALLAAAPQDRANLLLDFLAEQAASILGYNGNLDTAQPLSFLGMDSLMAVELKNRVERQVGVVISVVELLHGPSVAELTALVLDRLSEAPSTDNAGADEDWEEGEL